VELVQDFEPIEETVKQTRSLLLQVAEDDYNALVALVQFELDIAEVEDSPQCKGIVCQSYREVYTQ
jgi:hypothetical protein